MPSMFIGDMMNFYHCVSWYLTIVLFYGFMEAMTIVDTQSVHNLHFLKKDPICYSNIMSMGDFALKLFYY